LHLALKSARRIGVPGFLAGDGAGGEGFGILGRFHDFGFVVHFTLYGVTKRVTDVTKRVTRVQGSHGKGLTTDEHSGAKPQPNDTNCTN